MGDMAEVFNGMRIHDKELRQKNLHKAKELHDLPWTKHTEDHWSMQLNGEQLDYWPSRNKHRYQGNMYYGGIRGFIRNRQETK